MNNHLHNDPAIKISDYCDKCLTLFGTREGLRLVCDEGGYLHWPSKSDLRTKSKFCGLCRLVWKSRSWNSTKILGALHTYAVESERSSNGLNRLAAGRLEVRDSLGESALVYLYLTTPADNAASTVIRTRPIPSVVNDDRTVQQVQHWLSTCQQSHPSCAAPRSSWLPVRLIDITLVENCSVVHLTSIVTPDALYVALSYCWGNIQQSVTTRQNIDQREVGMSLEDLPQTVQDAIIFTRKLGLRYLWIDSLCIIQDDEEDRNMQIELMGEIYKNAFLTIAASTAVSVKEGFLQPRDKMDNSVNVPLFISQSLHGIVNVATWRVYNLWEESLHLRCWSFQELVLSPRILLFSRYQVLWRCPTEKMLPAETSHIVYTAFNVLPRQVFGASIHASTSLQKQQQDIWPNIVSEYSKRGVTYPLDRVSALVGVSKELSRAWQDVYVLGLWSRTFVQNLAWRVGAQQEICTQRTSKIIPSWSWLSVKNRAELWPLLRDSDAEVIQPPCGLDQIMTIEDLKQKCTIIHLRARVIDATSMLRYPLVSSTRLQRWGSLDYWVDLDINESDRTDARVLFVLLGYVKSKSPDALCLLLRHDTTQGSTIIWQRIGRVRIWSHDWATTSYCSLFIK